MHLILKIPPWLSTKIFYVLVISGYFWRFLSSTLVGVLILSVSIYLFLFSYGVVNPLTPQELIDWLANISTDFKIAITSSLLTILGFLIAFHTATANWKQQLNAQIKISAAGEIEDFFAEACGLLTNTNIFIASVIDSINNIQKTGKTTNTLFNAQHIMENLPQFISTRERLSALSINCHRLSSKHISFLMSTWGAAKILQLAIDAFTDTTDKMWVFIPYIEKNDPNLLSDLITTVNITDCLAFQSAYETNFSYINGLIGGLRGQLLAPVAGFNFAGLVTLIENKKINKEAFSILHKSHKDRS